VSALIITCAVIVNFLVLLLLVLYCEQQEQEEIRPYAKKCWSFATWQAVVSLALAVVILTTEAITNH
jgi:hypothetical protein